MTAADIDQVSAIKASLEMMVSENNGIHEYFKDLLEKVSELEALPPEQRHDKFTDLTRQGAFKFNGLDIRHFTRTQRKPLSPPVFLNRTRRRLKNTNTLIDAFLNKGMFEEGTELRDTIDALTFEIVDESDPTGVMTFKEKVEALRESALFQRYMDTKRVFVQQDSEIKAEADFLASKESVEEGEEIFRQREEDLNLIGERLDNGELSPEEAQAQLDSLALDKAG